MKVLTCGTFDILNPGHVVFLRRCWELAGRPSPKAPYFGWQWVTVGLNTDRFAASYKREPFQTYQDREAVLLATRYVSRVAPNDQPDGTIRGLIDLYRPDVVAASMDWYPREGRDWFAQVGVPIEEFAERGIVVAWLPYTPGVSTTLTLARVVA